MLSFGIYEQIISQVLREELDKGDGESATRELDSEEVAERVALHLAQLLRNSIEGVSKAKRLEFSKDLSNGVVDLLRHLTDQESEDENLLEPLEILTGVFDRQIDGRPRILKPPTIPLLDTVLLTNAPGEPSASVQISSEIESADEVMLIMAFVRRSGLRRFRSALHQHCMSGKRLRVLTTTFTRSTESAALQQLADLGAEVRVSYNETSTRLHAKGWLFERKTGFSTGYIGSSNLTHTAQETGLEWNLRISGKRNPDAIKKMRSMFEAYWESGDFLDFDGEEFAERTQVNQSPDSSQLSPIEIRLEPFQERLLEEIAIARSHGKHKNLLVAATGTGKTVMAAVDYERLARTIPNCKLLFVAHTKEILQQSRATFRHALRDGAFGELWVGGQKPDRNHHVFASIQSLSSAGYENFPANQFDVVIVDEFHHAAAKTYTELLAHIHPIELLGLTATPERADGQSVVSWFDDEISAELRLWDAIDQRRLSVFEYFGVSDQLDYKSIPWRRGSGYDINSLENLYTSNDAWARQVVKTVEEHVDDIGRICALGFCVSVKHAQFMAAHFQRYGYKAEYVSGNTEASIRDELLTKLRARELNILFAVDLLNEGVDLPNVDTLLMLRPTDSPVLFTQQLGRGLRKHPDKTSCLVLDFIGQHRKEYRIERRLTSILRGGRKDIQRQVENGFPYLPAGCHMELDRVAKEAVLRSLKDAAPSRWNLKAAELRSIWEIHKDCSLEKFLEESGLQIDDVYPGGGKSGWSDLKEAAGIELQPKGEFETALRKGAGRLLHVTDAYRLETMSKFLDANPSTHSELNERERRTLKMLLAEIFQSVKALVKQDIESCWHVLQKHPQVVDELRQVFGYLASKQDHMHSELTSKPDLPLLVHAKYSRPEILAGFGIGDVTSVRSKPWREGAIWSEVEQADVFVITLNKSKGSFSPTTMYRDYAISRELFHWESQSQVKEDSLRGKRYQNHAEDGSTIMLFARSESSERAFWFLGPATYVSHSSEKPMEVTWRLQYQLPGDLYEVFAAAVA